MCMLRSLIVASAALLMLQQASAQSSKEFAAMGLASWAAFECATLASHSKDAKAQERLFTHGYKLGQAFVSAARNGKIEAKDMSSKVPLGVVWLLEGPTTDFILGRIYENAQENSLKDVLKTDGIYNSNELQVSLARNKFRKSNCALLGTL